MLKKSHSGLCNSPEKQHTVRDVEQPLKLVLGSGDSLDVGQMEKARRQSSELVVREVHLL